jgi:methionyl-tRNA synthetase
METDSKNICPNCGKQNKNDDECYNCGYINKPTFYMVNGITSKTYKDGKKFFFNTQSQEEVENYMTLLGYGCSEYFLSNMSYLMNTNR